MTIEYLNDFEIDKEEKEIKEEVKIKPTENIKETEIESTEFIKDIKENEVESVEIKKPIEKKVSKEKEKVNEKIPQNNTLLIIENYAKQYDNYIKQNKPKDAIKSFSNIVLLLDKKFDTKACNYIIDKFKKNKGILLNRKLALQGIENISVVSRIKVETFYTLLSGIINKKRKSILKIDFDKVRKFFDNQDMTNYFIKKYK